MLLLPRKTDRKISSKLAYLMLQLRTMFRRCCQRTLTRPMFLCAISAAGVLLMVFSALLQKIDNNQPDFRLSFKNVFRFMSDDAPGDPWDICVGGNASLGEVEDILCMPKPDYVQNMKNPCWWVSKQTLPSGLKVNATFTRSLSCLPYFHIICCSKSGTTDLFHRIKLHPDIVPNTGTFGKELLFWSWAKYGLTYTSVTGKPRPFSKYIESFSVLAKQLEKAASRNGSELKRLVTLDASPPDMWDLRGWTKLPQNRKLRHPAVLTPHLMRHLYRDPKFIVLVREPVERLYTSYLFHNLGKTASKFHSDVVKGLAMFDRCLATVNDRIECFINHTFTSKLPMSLHYSCYVVFFEEWLKVFPRKHFLFLRTEDYSKYMNSSLLQIFSFLDLTPPSTKDLQRMLEAPKSYHTKIKDSAGPMLNETRALLRKWFKPWNEQLARFLKDDRYLWLQ